MFREQVYKRRAKEKEGLQLQEYNNNNAGGECCCWVPGTPAKEKNPGPVSSNPEAELYLIDLNKSIDEWQHEAAQLVELINVAAPAAPQESAILSPVLVSGKGPEPNGFLLPISDKNPISSPESCVSPRK